MGKINSSDDGETRFDFRERGPSKSFGRVTRTTKMETRRSKTRVLSTITLGKLYI